MTDQKKIHRVASEECILDAAEIVLGEKYADHRPFDHLGNPAVRNELKRAGFSHAIVRAHPDRISFKAFSLDHFEAIMERGDRIDQPLR